MRKIKVSYWNYPNIGDLLGPYIISALTGKEIIGKDLYSYRKFFQLKRFIKFLLKKISYKELKRTCFYWDKTILSVGSILKHSNKNTSVWGSGFMSYEENFNGGKIFALRGPLSNKKIIDSGFRGCDVYGDPALLLPLLIGKEEKIFDIAIIPHHIEYEFFNEKYGEKFKIINLCNCNIIETIKEITSCKTVLSTSLHGIIISHAYKIPAIWIKHRNIGTDGFKFFDYFSSVDIPIYEGFQDVEKILGTKKSAIDFVLNHSNISLPRKDIESIQKQLLRNAPFEVIDKYKKCNQ